VEKPVKPPDLFQRTIRECAFMENKDCTGQAIEDRLTDFAASIADLYEALPRTFFGRHYGQQILRAATGAAANCAEVRAAESKNDFIHKLGIVRKELCECLVWLRLIARKHLVSEEILDPIRDECDQLVRIVSASKITAERNARLGKKKEEAEKEVDP
jgi:four helix bundle protein